MGQIHETHEMLAFLLKDEIESYVNKRFTRIKRDEDTSNIYLRKIKNSDNYERFLYLSNVLNSIWLNYINSEDIIISYSKDLLDALDKLTLKLKENKKKTPCVISTYSICY